ncbi:YceI family protein [Streptomyces sp. NPDC005438]|uniref:YceI family protein n=1 Tax=Streptomyces sp. NPDC005438 TaxID=3156880 RepID=UPI0033A4D4D7
MDTTQDTAKQTPKLGRYTIDTEHSTVRFGSRHLFGLMPVRGTFGLRGGTVDVAEPVSESRTEVEVDATSFHTGNDHRDQDVRSAKFLDTDTHPTITFASDRVDGTTLVGRLTACGVERPVTLQVEEVRVTEEGFTARASTRVDRTEFGVTAARGMAGRHLAITVEVTCRRS